MKKTTKQGGASDGSGGADLRRRAEAQLKEHKPGGAAPYRAADLCRLIHELEVHRVELDIQNEELRASRLETEAGLAKYTEIFDFAPIGYATLASDGTIHAVNHAGAALLGEPRSLLAGRRFGVFVAPDDRGAFGALLANIVISETKEVCEITLAREGRAPVVARLTAALLTCRSPVILLAFEDVTEQRSREQQLELAERALRDVDHRKDMFLAVLSHELRNPLTPIGNSLAILESVGSSSEQAHRARAVIGRQVVHLTRLIDDLLDVTRIKQGKIALRRERLELAEVVRRAMDDHRAEFEARAIHLEGRFGEELFWVDGDVTRITQVVANLLGNAAKFTPPSGKVEVSLRAEGATVVLRVRDTGMGIAPEVVDHIFQPFMQAPQTLARTQGGLGLGLALVKTLVELHGGSVEAASEGQGGGAELTVRLPLDTTAASAVAQPAGPRRCAGPHRLLVIEDHVDAAESLKSLLELGAHDVRVAFDGPSGVGVARDFRPVVVFCDIGLPGMSGYEVARALRADEGLRDVVLVALTGYGLHKDKQSAVEAGFTHHITKPPSLEIIEEILADVG